jgi:hypothetical protein
LPQSFLLRRASAEEITYDDEACRDPLCVPKTLFEFDDVMESLKLAE